jgi:hypothetical protein
MAPTGAAPRCCPGSSWSSARRATSTLERLEYWLPGLELNQRPPVSGTGLRTNTECLAMAVPTGVAPAFSALTGRHLHDFDFGTLAGRGGIAPPILDLETSVMLLHQRPLERPAGLAPASRVWKTRTLLLSYGRMHLRTGGDPTAFPTEGVPLRFCCVPARLSKGSAVKTLPATRPVPG